MSEKTKEVAKLIVDNPDLRIVALCGEECCSYDYGWMSNWNIKGQLCKVCQEDKINDERFWVLETDEDELIEKLCEGDHDLLPGITWKEYRDESKGKVFTYHCDPYKNGVLLTDAEIEAIAQEYIDNMKWEKVIALWVNP